MDNPNSTHAGKGGGSKRVWNWPSIVLLVVVIAVLYLFSPAFHDRHFGVAKNESAAVGGLRRINSSEGIYATSHPNQGFACELSLLGSPMKSGDPYDPTKALLTGTYSGYKFSITDCAAGVNGIVASYNLTAVPSGPGITGVRAFCSDQSGLFFYDLNGSASECLRSRKQLIF